jgi:hypothetical protein
MYSPSPPLTDKDLLEIFELRLAGWTLERLAKKFRKQLMTIQVIVTGSKFTTRLPDHPKRLECVSREAEKLTKSRRYRQKISRNMNRAIALYQDGNSLRDAARRCGFGFMRLWKELKKRQIPSRPIPYSR